MVFRVSIQVVYFDLRCLVMQDFFLQSKLYVKFGNFIRISLKSVNSVVWVRFLCEEKNDWFVICE